MKHVYSEEQQALKDAVEQTLEERAIETVSHFYDRWIDETKELREKCKNIKAMTWVFKKLNKVESDNKTLINKCYENVQTILPRLYAQRPKFQIFARSTNLSKKPELVEMAEMAKALLDYQWDDYDLDDMFYECGNFFLTYGTHVILVGTDIVIKSRTKKKKGSDKKEMDTYIARDTQGIKHIPIWDFMIHPKDKEINKAPAVGYRESNVLLDDLYSTGLYMNLEKVKVNFDGGEDHPEYNPDADVDSDKEDLGQSNFTKLATVPEVLHYYGLFKVDKDKHPVEYIISVAGCKDNWTLIRMEENFFEDEHGHPYRPFVDFHDEKNPHSFYSIGEVEKIMGLQAVLNTFWRQRIDAIRKSLRSKWIVQEDTVIDESAITTDEDNAIIKVKANTIIPPSPVAPNNVTEGLYRDIVAIGAELNQISGITDAVRGAPTEASRSATAVAIDAQVGDNRFSMKLRNLQKSIKKYIRIRVMQNGQFFNKKLTARLFKSGEMLEKEINPFPIVDVDIIIEPGSTQARNSVAEQQKAALLGNIAAQFGQVPFDQLPPFIQFSVKEQLQALGYEDIDKILGVVKPDPEAMQNQAEKEAIDRESQMIDEENIAMAQGQPVKVNRNNDHKFHLQAHADFMAEPEFDDLPEDIQIIFHEHLFNHKTHEKSQTSPGGKSMAGIIGRPGTSEKTPPRSRLPNINGEGEEPILEQL